jgi:hypothetical protein
MRGPRRLLIASLLVMYGVIVLKAHLGTIWPVTYGGVDLEIPLRAADRWMHGGVPYDLAAFEAGPGATQPFLYPPFTLPLFAALTYLPRAPLLLADIAIMLVAAIATCRRLQIPWLWMPLVLAWPPFAEGIVDGNVAMLMFLAFVLLFYRPSGGTPWHPAPRDIAEPTESGLLVGSLSSFIATAKVSQPHAWLFVLRYRWRAAVLGAVVVGAIALATVPITGLGVWGDWIAQLKRAGEGNWDHGGFAVPRFLPPGVGLVVVAVCFVATWFAPRRDPAPWVGVLSTFGSLSLHIFGLLFLVPSMLKIPIEAALMAAIFIATYSYEGAWGGILVCTLSLAVAGRAARDGLRTAAERGRPEPQETAPSATLDGDPTRS